MADTGKNSLMTVYCTKRFAAMPFSRMQEVKHSACCLQEWHISVTVNEIVHMP